MQKTRSTPYFPIAIPLTLRCLGPAAACNRANKSVHLHCCPVSLGQVGGRPGPSSVRPLACATESAARSAFPHFCALYFFVAFSGGRRSRPQAFPMDMGRTPLAPVVVYFSSCWRWPRRFISWKFPRFDQSASKILPDFEVLEALKPLGSPPELRPLGLPPTMASTLKPCESIAIGWDAPSFRACDPKADA